MNIVEDVKYKISLSQSELETLSKVVGWWYTSSPKKIGRMADCDITPEEDEIICKFVHICNSKIF